MHPSSASMTKPKPVIIAVGSILFVGTLLWLLWPPHETGRSVTIAVVTNALSPSSGGPLFRIRNDDQRAILLTDLIVETNSPTGWRAFSHTTPTDPQRLATGDTKDLVLAPPGDGIAWRLRVTYGKDVKGPLLLWGKVDYAISEHVWPNRSFGMMVGSNSCVSEVMSK
jgi:hypothetical protein